MFYVKNFLRKTFYVKLFLRRCRRRRFFLARVAGNGYITQGNGHMAPQRQYMSQAYETKTKRNDMDVSILYLLQQFD